MWVCMCMVLCLGECVQMGYDVGGDMGVVSMCGCIAMTPVACVHMCMLCYYNHYYV